MSNKEERFVLYEYLLYFWRKKWAFLVVPIITIVLAIVVNYLFFKPDPYSGQSTIYVGSVTSKQFTDPINVTSTYKEQVQNNNLHIFVPSDGYLKVEITGEDRDSIESDLTSISQKIENDLSENIRSRIETTETNVQILKKIEEVLEKIDQSYGVNIESDDPTELEMEYLTAIVKNGTELSDTVSSITKSNNNLALLEEPAILESSVTKSKTYMVESAIIGLILGLILTLALLVLLKYIEDAKRYYASKKGI